MGNYISQTEALVASTENINKIILADTVLVPNFKEYKPSGETVTTNEHKAEMKLYLQETETTRLYMVTRVDHDNLIYSFSINRLQSNIPSGGIPSPLNVGALLLFQLTTTPNTWKFIKFVIPGEIHITGNTKSNMAIYYRFINDQIQEKYQDSVEKMKQIFKEGEETLTLSE